MKVNRDHYQGISAVIQVLKKEIERAPYIRLAILAVDGFHSLGFDAESLIERTPEPEEGSRVLQGEAPQQAVAVPSSDPVYHSPPGGVRYSITEDGNLVPRSDPVHHPAHYTAHASGVECIQITEHMNFCLGNAVKYLWRNEAKGGIQDLEKAVWYINREIARRKGSAP